MQVQAPMTRIVREHYPVEALPADLREGLDPSAEVRVTVEQRTPADSVAALEAIFAARRPPFRSRQDIDEDLRRLREEWDDRA